VGQQTCAVPKIRPLHKENVGRGAILPLVLAHDIILLSTLASVLVCRSARCDSESKKGGEGNHYRLLCLVMLTSAHCTDGTKLGIVWNKSGKICRHVIGLWDSIASLATDLRKLTSLPPHLPSSSHTPVFLFCSTGCIALCFPGSRSGVLSSPVYQPLDLSPSSLSSITVLSSPPLSIIESSLPQWVDAAASFHPARSSSRAPASLAPSKPELWWMRPPHVWFVTMLSRFMITTVS
jgi:hypothetical protein